MLGKDDTDQKNDSGSNESAQKMLYSFILDPPPDRLPELTDLPLLQIPVLNHMATFDAVIRESADRVQYAIEFRRYQEAQKNGGKDSNGNEVEKPTPPEVVMPSEEFRTWLYKHRRSLGGAGVIRAAVLAERQLEVQQEISPDQIGNIAKD
jgi:hypothetical protein